MTTTRGAILVDAAQARTTAREDLPAAAVDAWFDPAFWAGRGQCIQATAGRGAAWFVGPGSGWVLRHYRRGGWVAWVAQDRYVWCGEARVRAMAEWRLLAALAARGLPVPKPVAARYQREGVTYRCDLITERIVGARPLSAALTEAALADATWAAVGVALARLHQVGADHADLNAHNILVDAAGRVTVIDFDRGTMRLPGAWSRGNLARLHRSLRKVARQLPPQRFSAATWGRLLAGYAAAAAVSASAT